jgi:hypothetical protein
MLQPDKKSALLAAAHKKAGLKPKKLMEFFAEEGEELFELFVQAKPAGKKKWETVGGPFGNRPEADAFAKQYATDNHVPTRVIGFQTN